MTTLAFYKVTLRTDHDVTRVFRSKRSEPGAKKPATAEELQKRLETAAKIIPVAFNTSLMCIGSEIGGIGACEGDDGGPGRHLIQFIFDDVTEKSLFS